MDFIQGMGAEDQKEIDTNKVSVLLNIAAVLMERGEHAAACKHCTEALALDPKNVRGLVRRAQCLIARHQHKASLVTKCFWLLSCFGLVRVQVTWGVAPGAGPACLVQSLICKPV